MYVDMNRCMACGEPAIAQTPEGPICYAHSWDPKVNKGYGAYKEYIEAGHSYEEWVEKSK